MSATSDHGLSHVASNVRILSNHFIDEILKEVAIITFNQRSLVFGHRWALKITNGIRTNVESFESRAKYGLVRRKLLQKTYLPTRRRDCGFIILIHLLLDELRDQFSG